MGATTFTVRCEGKTADEAFHLAVDQARYEHGHGGYTGTIAEKSSFRMVRPNQGESAGECVDRLMEDDSSFVQDKWGPAGCIELGPAKGEAAGLKQFLFFGWASE